MNFFRFFLTGATEASQEAPNVAENMSGMIDTLDMLLLIMLLGFGVYAIYSAIRLYKEQLLFPNKILYPGNCAPEDCILEGEFIDYIVPRILFFGLSFLLMGVAMALNMYVFKLSSIWVDLSTMVFPVTVIVIYVVMQRKAAKLFWTVELPEEKEK